MDSSVDNTIPNNKVFLFCRVRAGHSADRTGRQSSWDVLLQEFKGQVEQGETGVSSVVAESCPIQGRPLIHNWQGKQGRHGRRH